jgi:F-type H+-transporting ATPase subunit delta
MKEQSVARIYAKSLLELGDEKKVNIADELINLTEVINKSNELENVLFLDLFTMDEKKIVFSEVAQKISLSPITTETIKFLIDEKRIGLLPLIAKEVIVLDDERKGFMKGVVEGNSSAIDAGIKKKIEDFLQNKFGKTPQLQYVQNTNLTAGYKVTIEDLQLDASLDNQLEQFKQSILSE